MLDIQTNEVFISCNVVFHENIFPFCQSSPIADHDEFFPRLYVDQVAPPPASSSSPGPECPAVDITSTSTPRVSKPLRHLQEYHCRSVNSSTEHPISNVLSYDALSDPYQIFINSVNSILESRTFAQACKLKEW